MRYHGKHLILYSGLLKRGSQAKFQKWIYLIIEGACKKPPRYSELRTSSLLANFANRLMEPDMHPPTQACPPIHNISSRTWSIFPHGWRARSLIGASMLSSQAVSSRISKWSQSGRTAPFELNFEHCQWANKACACETHKWYESQRREAEKNQSSTKFRRIQHRKDRIGPFYHEFLLLMLVDGSMYRVERTGTGSNADAIRPLGCKARDIIEWFPRQDEEFIHGQPSDLISEVTFPIEFDLLDVLAICYSISKHPQTRAYTLQRYNCYFFCCTILSILARRVADWEGLITAEAWETSLDHALEVFSALVESPIDSRPDLIPRLFSMLDSDHDPLRPIQCLVERLRAGLRSRIGYEGFVQAHANTLWWTDFVQSLEQHLGPLIQSSALETCSLNTICGTVFGFKGHTAEDDERMAAPDGRAVRMYKAEYLTILGALINNRRKTNSKVLHREDQVSYGAYLLAAACGPPIGVFRAMCKVNCKKRREWGKGVPWSARLAYATAWGRIVGPHIVLSYVTPRKFERDHWVAYSSRQSDVSTLEIPALNAVLDKLVKNSYQPEDVKSALDQCFAGLMQKDQDVWGERTVGPHLYLNLEKVAKEKIWVKSLEVEVSFPEQVKPTTMSVQTFQNNIREHIRKYANRVDSYKLSVAQLVARDVESSIAGIWELMQNSSNTLDAE